MRAHEPERIPDEDIDRRAAVAAIIREDHSGPQVLLIRRAEHPKDPWSGHMAFPGGREDEQDDDLRFTAVREAREEVGIDLHESGTLLGALHDVQAIARGRRQSMIIRPFVFHLASSVEIVPDRSEVVEAIWAPIPKMLDGSLSATHHFELDGQRYQMPAYDLDGRIVWGLTYRMLQQLFDLIR